MLFGYYFVNVFTLWVDKNQEEIRVCQKETNTNIDIN